MIDINKGYGKTDPIVYLEERISPSSIFRFILSHPHKDHLYGLNELAESYEIVNFWDTDHNFEPDKTSDVWEDYEGDWNKYQEYIGKESSPKHLYFLRDNDQVDFLNQNRIRVLSPSPELIDEAKDNEEDQQRVHMACYVLKVSYAGRNIIFGGDADETCWENILQRYKDTDMLKADVLKASHHGHESGYHREAVDLIDPDHVVITASSKEEHDASDKYRNNHGAEVHATWNDRNLVLYLHDDGKIEFKTNTKGMAE